MKKYMRYGLYGIQGVYNFGCEAIIRGAEKFINMIDLNATITYYSHNYEYDKNRLKDMNIKVEKIDSNSLFLLRITNKVLRLLKIKKQIPTFKYNKIFDEIDILFSIGGDIYTIPENQRSKSTYYYYNELIEFCDKAIKSGVEVIAYGASIGPFGKYKKAVRYYSDNLRKYKYIICRENKSIDYLKEIGVDNCVFFPDPAFQVNGSEENKNEVVSSQYIGINFSPLSFLEVFGSYSDCEKKVAELIDEIYAQYKYPIMLIPHVISERRQDNDYEFLKNVLKYVSKETREQIKMADYKNGFLGIKKEIKKCKIVVAARMHCAVNAIVENIPTIFMSYSQKSIGMSAYIYNSGKWCVSLKNIDKELIMKIGECINEYEQINMYLMERNKEIQTYISMNYKNFK